MTNEPLTGVSRRRAVDRFHPPRPRWLLGALLTLVLGLGAAVGAGLGTALPAQASSAPTASNQIQAHLAALDSAPTSTPSCGLNWRVVGSPPTGPLYAVAAVAATDVWAAGAEILHWEGTAWSTVSAPSIGTIYGLAGHAADDLWAVGTGILHWDGTAWSVSPSPLLGTLYSVAVVAADDVWAVGTRSGTPARSWIMHWDGSTWSTVSVPSVGAGDSLSGVAGVAAGDVWAVGSYSNGSVWQTLTLHLTGGQWVVVPSPNQDTLDNHLYGVTALPSGQVWAVGDYRQGPHLRTLALSWSGSTWTLLSTPNRGAENNTLYAVAANAPGDVWTVGEWYDIFTGGGYEPLVLRQWGLMNAPHYPPEHERLRALAIVAADDVWAVGIGGTFAAPSVLILRYNDPCAGATATPSSTATATWSATPIATAVPPRTPTPTAQLPELAGLLEWESSCPSPTLRLMVMNLHSHRPAGASTARLENRDGAFREFRIPALFSNFPYTIDCTFGGCLPMAWLAARPLTWTVDYYNEVVETDETNNTSSLNSPPPPPTVCPSATPGGLPTNTPCPVQFADVPPTGTFYPFIRCLACRGIVQGYPCGGPGEPCPGTYFRPNTTVTRGQTAKIVSEAVGFADPVPSTQQTFEDVPPGSPFHLYIERLASRGSIGGYPCGGPFEPCVAPTNRPYFRPGNNVTRGQLSKITGGAASWWTETPTAQTFEDVAPGSPFSLWIERLAGRGIISGYPCGGAGEPCIGPTNRPYFRPNHNATRGQMSKIAANTFYPNCQTPAARPAP